jgi:accessory colonization factor AcfC
MSNVPITYGFGAVLVSEKALRKVDPADLEILKSVSRKHSQILIDKTRIQNVEAIQAIQGEGVKVLEIDGQVQNEFFTTGRSAWEDGVGRLYPQDLLERVSSIVADYRENHKEAKNNP